MAKCGRTNLSGGGGIGSDELTATANKILKNYTYVGADTDDEIGTGTIESMEGQTVTPDASEHTIECKNKYLTGNIVIPAVDGLTAENVAVGATVGGVLGTYNGLGNATAENVLSGKTFSTAELSNATGTMGDYSSKTSTSSYAGGTFRSGTTGYVFASPSSSGYYTSSSYIRIPATNLSAANIKKGVSILGITGTLDEGYWTSPLYLFDSGWTDNLQTKGMTITANSSGGYFYEDGIDSSVTTLNFFCRCSSSSIAMARLNQTFNLTNYNYIKATGQVAIYFQLGIGISTSASVSSVSSLAAKAYLTTAIDSSLATVSPILNVSNYTGNYYIYLFANCTSSTTISGAKANSFSQLWCTNV